jgi:hypothetical protein
MAFDVGYTQSKIESSTPFGFTSIENNLLIPYFKRRNMEDVFLSFESRGRGRKNKFPRNSTFHWKTLSRNLSCTIFFKKNN